MPGNSWERVPIGAQSIDAPLSQAAIFLVMTVPPGPAALVSVRSALGGIDDLVKTVGFRDLLGRLSCVVGIGSDLWDRLHPGSRPGELKPFERIDGATHHAPSTPGDLLFHIRAERPDLCFEFERLLLASLGEHAATVDEVAGFRYFDARDLLGFVDGTANPAGPDLLDCAVVGEEDAEFAGGSYVVVQRYLHDLARWEGLPTSMQERIVGRRKSDNVEIDDDDAPAKSHKSLCTIVDGNGGERDILRDNMPFGRPGHGQFGTYFIGYARHLWVVERMLRRMYVGDPPGAHDRLLEFSTPQTGTTFFAPARATLAAIAGSGSDGGPAAT